MNSKVKWLAPVLGFAGTAGCIQTANVADTLALSNSFFSVLLFVALTLLSAKALDCIGASSEKPKQSGVEGENGAAGRRDWIWAGIGAFFMSVALGFGRQLDRNGSVEFLSIWLWAAILCMTIFLTPMVVWGFMGLDRLRAKCGGNKSEKKTAERILKNGRIARIYKSMTQSFARCFVLTAVGLFVCWIPVWLAGFPGFFAYDATDELNQVLTGEYVTRHPLLHVLLLGKTVAGFYELTGDWNTGIIVFELFQMALMACIFSWLLGSIRKLGAPRLVWFLGFIFLGLFPVISVFVLCTSKDTMYCAGMLAVLMLLWRLAINKDSAKADKGRERKADQDSLGKRYWIGLFIALFSMATFRNNGFYVFLVMIPVMLLLAGRKYWKKMTVCLICALLLTKGSAAVLEAALSPGDTGIQETLTVPIQQVTRAYIYSPELFSEEEKETLYEILPEEVLQRYNPKLSDMVKIDFQTANFEKDPGKYVQLWAKIGLRAPFTYVNAWLMTSYGFWYPDTIIDVYNGQRYYTQSSYFSFETEEPGRRESKLPLLEKVYRKFSWEILQQRIPAVSMLFSPGFLCWIYILAGLYLIARKQLRLVGALLPVYLNWLTVLLGPTYLVRYVLIFWFALPLLVWMVLRDHCCHAQKSMLY